MLAGLLIGLVHVQAAGDKGGEAAGFQPLDRAGDKIIMQGESETASRIIGTYGAITERRIADGESVRSAADAPWVKSSCRIQAFG